MASSTDRRSISLHLGWRVWVVWPPACAAFRVELRPYGHALQEGRPMAFCFPGRSQLRTTSTLWPVPFLTLLQDRDGGGRGGWRLELQPEARSQCDDDRHPDADPKGPGAHRNASEAEQTRGGRGTHAIDCRGGDGLWLSLTKPLRCEDNRAWRRLRVFERPRLHCMNQPWSDRERRIPARLTVSSGTITSIATAPRCRSSGRLAASCCR